MPIMLRDDGRDGDLSWLCIKVLFAWFWLRQIANMISFGGDCPYPVGICKLHSFNFLFAGTGVWLLWFVLVVCLVLYLAEKHMLLATGLLTILTCIIISHHESSGILLRATPYTTVFAAQFIAYLLAALTPSFDLRVYRQQYAVQIIAATYTIAAISKFMASGTGWVDDGSNFFAVQVVKSFSFLYYDTADVSALEKGNAIARFLLNNKPLTKLLLGTSLLLELFCVTVILNQRLKLIYGIALLLMHAGINYSMNILIGGVAYPMAIFFINPLYWLVMLYKKLIILFKQQPKTAS